MVENFKLSAHQFFILVLLFTVGTVILHTPSPLATFAKQDAWISAIVGTCLGLIMVSLYIWVGKLHPDLPLNQVIEKVFGKWIGRIINLTFFLWTYSTAAELIYYVGDFINTFWMPETPLSIINLLFVLVVIMAVRLGFETFIRSLEILFIPFVLLLTLMVISVLPQINIQNLQPVFEGGFKPVLRAALFYISVFSMSPVMFLMIFPSKINQPKQGEKAFYIGTLIGGIILIIVILLNLLVLGPFLTANHTAPSYSLAKKINVGNFLMRIEVIIAAIWIVTVFVRTVMYFYVSVIVFANIVNIRDYRPITSLLGMILVLFSLVVYPYVQTSNVFMKEIWLYYASTYGLLLPLLLLIVFKIKLFIKKINNQTMD